MRITAALLVAMLVGLGGCSSTPPVNVQSPAPDVIAVVLGQRTLVKDRNDIVHQVLTPLLSRFAQENGLEPSEEEVSEFTARMNQREEQSLAQAEECRAKLMEELKGPSLSDQERKQKESLLVVAESNIRLWKERDERTMGKEERDTMRAIQRQRASTAILVWKVNKALYAKYGGRVAWQPDGSEPLDAYRKFLRAQKRAGAFRIFDKQCEADFWRYFTDGKIHTFYRQRDAAKHINNFWWLPEWPPALR